MAQNTSTTKVQTDDGFSSQGIRVSFIKPTLEAKGKVKYQNFGGDFSGKPDSVLGVAVGYANLPVQELGFTTNLALIEMKSESSANIARIDGNLGYAFNNYVNLKGGLNIMKYYTGEGLKNFNPGFGYQASLGFQLNKTVGFDIGYTEQNTSGKAPVTMNGIEIGKADVDLKLSGLELGLNATF